ncbi:unnamed protein product, partial [Linum tenue]
MEGAGLSYPINKRDWLMLYVTCCQMRSIGSVQGMYMQTGSLKTRQIGSAKYYGTQSMPAMKLIGR